MMKWRNRAVSWMLVLFAQLTSGHSFGQTDYKRTSSSLNGQVFGQTVLQTLDQKVYRLSALHKKLVAVVFLSPECPLCQNYTLTLNKLQERFGKDLDIVGVFPGKSTSSSECQAFRDKYKVRFLLLRDNSKSLVKTLGARITPEVFLLNQETILYHGAIDDWVVALGKQRKKATENYLEDGIEDHLKGIPVKIKEAKPIGCFINEF